MVRSSSEIVTSLSNNEFVAENGYYYEDYYWDSALTEAGGVYLEQYNGHTDSRSVAGALCNAIRYFDRPRRYL